MVWPFLLPRNIIPSRANEYCGGFISIATRDHAKLAYCLAGTVLDAVVDLRRALPLSANTNFYSNRGKRISYIPSGLAHGFYVQRVCAHDV